MHACVNVRELGHPQKLCEHILSINIRYASLKLMPRFENPSLGRNSETNANAEDLNANAEGLNANAEDT